MAWKDYLRDEMIDANVVIGTNSNNYICKLNHRSKATNRPITGIDWATYWDLTTDFTGSTWVVNNNYHIRQDASELNGLVDSVASVNASITHWQHWRDIYQGIQGEDKTNLEAQLAVKAAYWELGYFYPAWLPNHSYAHLTYARPTTVNSRKYWAETPLIPYVPPQYNPDPPYEELYQRVNGTSGGTEPTWPTGIGSTVVDNNITWHCEDVVITYPNAGAGYGTTNLTAWDVRDSGTIVYRYSPPVNWDADPIIIKAMTDWNTMYPLINNTTYGALAMITNLGTALVLVTNWKNTIAARNPVLKDYD